MTEPLSFKQLALPKSQLDNLANMGYQQMTEIQQQALPHVLSGDDVLAQAKTGSGKTAAFAIGMLEQINPRFFGAQGLVLCPTRELATQVAADIRKLARYLSNIKIVVLCGGQSIGPQIGSLAHGGHIIVGTPGRIKDHLRKNTLDISQIKTLVLDEADRMLDMGFSDDIHHIAAHTPEQRQTLLFSATYPDNIQQLSREFQTQPVHITITDQHTQMSIVQHMVACEESQKFEALKRVLANYSIQQAVIFCNTKQATQNLAQSLQELRFSALALHGDLDQKDRDRMFIRFKQKSAHFLIATDVAARGLDVDDLPAVINYDLPRDTDVYIHRIGRTGRAGKQGMAFSLVSPKEQYKLDALKELATTDYQMSAFQQLDELDPQVEATEYSTLCLSAGRKDKLRAGDILGALTNNGGIAGDGVGNIDILDFVSYVAIRREYFHDALQHLQQGRIKGRNVKVRKA